MNATAMQFSEQKYVVLPCVLEAPRVQSMYRHTLHLLRACKWTRDRLVPTAPSLYAEPLTEKLLLDLLPRIEEFAGLLLHPTYSYLRVYSRGDILKRHLDRPACEVSVTLNLGCEADAPWPLWLEVPAGVRSVPLEPGSALLYRGTECPHWREPFSGELAAQAMLHYVDKNGPHAEWKYDKRESLGIINISALNMP
jgi:hypothetical protein